MARNPHTLLKMDMQKVMIRLDKILDQNEELRKENARLRNNNEYLEKEVARLKNEAAWAKHPEAGH